MIENKIARIIVVILKLIWKNIILFVIVNNISFYIIYFLSVSDERNVTFNILIIVCVIKSTYTKASAFYY